MALIGTIVNAFSIILAALLGKLFHRIPDEVKGIVMQAISLVIIVLGLQMGFKSENYLIVIISVVLGAVIGEWLALEKKLNYVGKYIERKIGSNSTSSISQGFVTATLIFVIGAMAVLGALDSGLRGDHDILYTKSIIDGFTALILTTTLGIGVIFSAIPVFLYQGAIALFATQISSFIPDPIMEQFIIEMTSTGGIMIFAIGLNMLGVTTIRVANLLPSIAVVAMIVGILNVIPV
ncbi:DUF554 domain-containing protein [Bacillus sp. 2205SS5-2]|uniref:DUF554 domain-containing protein n=1 Tax=Bacillus sp. 2205SS5-2 TaxID=3109031 RepID=UPI003004D330